jgi:hypothetical protein
MFSFLLFSTDEFHCLSFQLDEKIAAACMAQSGKEIRFIAMRQTASGNSSKTVPCN